MKLDGYSAIFFKRQLPRLLVALVKADFPRSEIELPRFTITAYHRKPAEYVCVFYVRFQMINRLPVLTVPVLRRVDQSANQTLLFPQEELELFTVPLHRPIVFIRIEMILENDFILDEITREGPARRLRGRPWIEHRI